MSRNDRRFARIYYDDFEREFPDVYDDRSAFATWMYLLIESERAWPAQPHLPRSARKRDLDVLVRAGLLALGPRFTFSIRGHDAERTRRHSVAIVGANASANARANAQANAPAFAEPRREQDENKTRTPLPLTEGKRSNGTNQRAVGTNPRARGTSPRQVRESEKRGPSALHEILSSIQTKGKA